MLYQEQVSLKKEFDKLKEEKCKADDSLKTVQKENRKRRKVIEAYQDMMKAGATGLHPVSYLDCIMHIIFIVKATLSFSLMNKLRNKIILGVVENQVKNMFRTITLYGSP